MERVCRSPPLKATANFWSKSHYEFDRTILLKVFPEEIWELVLQNVEDHKSLQDLSNSSAFFYQRLLNRRKTYLFPGVIGLLIRLNKENDALFTTSANNAEDISLANQNQEGGNLEMNHLNNQVWQFPWVLRFVCKKWNKAFEDYCRNHEIFPFVETRKMFTFRENFHHSHRESLFVEKFGPVFKSAFLEFGFDRTFENLTDFFLWLVKILTHLSNIKELEIRYTPGEQTTRQTFQNIAQKCIPQMKSLNKLDIFGNLPLQICTELLRQNNQFEKLCLFLNHVDVGHAFDFSCKMQNLKDLTINVKFDKELEQLKRYGKNWKLSKFEGQFIYFEGKNSLHDIFKMVEANWSNTITELVLTLPDNPGWTPTNSIWKIVTNQTTSLRLQSMKVLKSVQLTTFVPISVDFLLPCSDTLEFLEVLWIGRRLSLPSLSEICLDSIDKHMVEFIGFENKMEKSNIWKMFPKLQKIRTFGRRFQRPATY